MAGMFLSAIHRTNMMEQETISVCCTIHYNMKKLLRLLIRHIGVNFSAFRTLSDLKPSGRHNMMKLWETTRYSFLMSEVIDGTSETVPSVDFYVVVGITELHFNRTMRRYRN